MASLPLSRRERFFLYNTLACLPKGLEGNYTTIDLRDDTIVTGKLDYVDGFMNITMTDAIYVNIRGDEYAFDHMHINARKIRYVHIPESMNMLSVIKNQIQEMTPKPRSELMQEEQKAMQSSRKGTKALMRHMKTVAQMGTVD